MRLLSLWLCALALGCASTVYLGENRDGGDAEVTAPPDRPDVSPKGPPDVTDARTDDITDVGPDAPPPSVCETLAQGRTLTGETTGVYLYPAPGARLPPPACARPSTTTYSSYRMTLDRRVGVLLTGAVAVRRVCDDPTTELACAERGVGGALRAILDAGTYDVITAEGFASWSFPIGHRQFFPAPPPGLDNDRCEGAIPLSADTTHYETLARASAPRAGCLPFETGPALYYRVTIPAGRRLVAMMRPTGFGTPEAPTRPVRTYVPTVRVLASCGAASCLAAAHAPEGYPATAAWTNTSSANVDVWVAVASTAEATVSDFWLDLRLAEPAASERCEDAPSLVSGATRIVDVGTATATEPSCPGEPSPATAVRYHRARVPAGHELVAVAEQTTYLDRFRPWIRLHAACGTAPCVGAHNAPTGLSNGAWTTPDVVRYANHDAVEREVIVAVGGLVDAATSTAATVRLTAWIRPLTEGARCDSPAEIPAGGSVYTTDDTAVRMPACAGLPSGSTARFLRITVPPRSVTRIPYLSLQANTARPQGFLISGCGLTCADVTPVPVSALGVGPFINPDDTPRSFVFAFTSDSATAPAIVRLTPVVSANPQRGTCANATRLEPGFSTSSGTWIATESTPCDGAFVGHNVFHRVNVPAGRVLTVWAGGSLLKLSLLAACGASSCLATRDGSASNGPTLAYANTTGSAQDLVLVIGRPGESTDGNLPLRVELAPFAANGRCASATPVSPGTTLRDQSTVGGAEPPYRTSTADAAHPFAVFYRVPVEAGRTLVVTARRPSGWQGAWLVQPNILTTCGGAMSSQSADALPDSQSANWTNTTGAAREVIVSMWSLPGEGNRFDASFEEFASVIPTASCAEAPALTEGQSLTGVRLTPTAPSSETVQPRVYYRATVAPGYELGLTTTAPVRVRESDVCREMGLYSSRLSQVHDAFAYMANPYPTTRQVTFSVTSATAAPVTTDLRVTLRPMAYAREVIPNSCEALTGAALALRGDDASAPVTALPFAFRYFGEAMQGYSVSTNGFVQLWPELTGTPDTRSPPSQVNAFPIAEAPARVVAPFWADLLTGLNGSIRAELVAGARRHLTVEWRDMNQCCVQQGTMRLSFQARFFEDDGSIEFHYCRLQPSGDARSNGAGAVVGLQNVDGTRSVPYGIFGGGAGNEFLSTSNGLRFTPVQ